MADHDDQVAAWRRARYQALRREVGWLTLAGLAWLQPGVNRIGSDPSVEVVLPSGPPVAGTVTVGDETVVADGAFTRAGEPVRQLPLADDEAGAPTMLEVGALRLCVIKRGDRLAIRTWDTAAERRRTFDGIDHWPVDQRWRIDARFEPTPGRTVVVPDVIGISEEEVSPGEVILDVAGGGTYRLQALEGGEAGQLWLVFADATNGSETYGGGRFLYTEPPSDDGRVVVDFNRAYNPPCVFTPYATCPLPWPSNRLPIRVTAGERMWGSPERAAH